MPSNSSARRVAVLRMSAMPHTPPATRASTAAAPRRTIVRLCALDERTKIQKDFSVGS